MVHEQYSLGHIDKENGNQLVYDYKTSIKSHVKNS